MCLIIAASQSHIWHWINKLFPTMWNFSLKCVFECGSAFCTMVSM